MSRFYGCVSGNLSKAEATRRGSQYIKSSVQSWHGSMTSELYYNHKDELSIDIKIDEDGSSMGGTLYFSGTFEEFKNLLGGAKK